MLILFIWKGDATFEVEPDFGLDITAVDTLGDDDVQPFYPKEMKHSDNMSKMFFCDCIQNYFCLYCNYFCRTAGCPKYF